MQVLRTNAPQLVQQVAQPRLDHIVCNLPGAARLGARRRRGALNSIVGAAGRKRGMWWVSGARRDGRHGGGSSSSRNGSTSDSSSRKYRGECGARKEQGGSPGVEEDHVAQHVA